MYRLSGRPSAAREVTARAAVDKCVAAPAPPVYRRMTWASRVSGSPEVLCIVLNDSATMRFNGLVRTAQHPPKPRRKSKTLPKR